VYLRRLLFPVWPEWAVKVVLPPICMAFLTGICGNGSKTIVSVASFVGAGPKATKVGTSVATVLNLQIWHTLRIPLTVEGRHTQGIVTWDYDWHPPASFAEADSFAAEQKSQEPQIVLWGRAWRYGSGIVAEPFLLIRYEVGSCAFGEDLWSVARASGEAFSVGVPDRQIEFAPITIHLDSLSGLPSGLKLYGSPTSQQSVGVVGDYFTALEQGPDAVKVRIPNGTQGWIHLPLGSREHSNVVDFTEGIIKIFRKDWDGASAPLIRVGNDIRAPTNVRSNAFLYLAIAAAHSGGDALQWVSKAYELTPFSKTTLQYLCMAKLDELQKAGEDRELRSARLDELRRIVLAGSPLYAPDDPWFLRLKKFLDEQEPQAKRQMQLDNSTVN
jgi:hypothetical protein